MNTSRPRNGSPLRSCLCILLFAIGLTSAQADSSAADQLIAQYEARLEAEAGSLLGLQQKYVENLEVLREATRNEGDAEALVAIDKELNSYADDSARGYSSWAKLDQLRKIYERASEPIINEMTTRQESIHREFEARFEEAKRYFTQQDNVAAAQRMEEYRLAAEQALSGAATESAPAEGEPLWAMVDESSVTLHDLELNRRGGRWRIEGGFGEYLASAESVQLPVTVHARVATDSTNIRFYFNERPMVILNWEENLRELKIRPPGTQTMYGTPEKGYLEPDELYDVTLELLTDLTRVLVNGELRGEVTKPVGQARGTIGIGPGFGSEVTIESFEVFEAPAS